MNHFKKNDSKYLVIVSCCLIFIISLAFGCSKNSISTGKIENPKELNTTKTTAALLAAPVNTRVVVFNGGNESIYHSFRIPSIIKTKKGTLVAFAEGRRWSPSDYGDINVVYKRSINNGASWLALGEVVGSGAGTWGNPTAVYDQSEGENGRIWLFLEWNDEFKTQWSDFKAWGDRRIHTSYSDDDGVTWSTPLDRTSSLTPTTYKWDCVGPGIGIKTAYDHPGRLIIPAYGRNIYSDDHGATWQYELTGSGTDESTIVELMNGSLMRNDRPGTTEWNLSKTRRKSVGSIAGGFPAFSTVAALPDPKCEGSMLRYNTDDPNRIIFLNPNGIGQRCNMTVRISYDDGVTWPRSRALYNAANCDYTNSTVVYGGYSSMVKTADYCIGALVEYNENVQNSASSNKSIEFNKFNLAWILNGSTEP
nr:sialidase family protein [uncultured Pedobacter sp.]